LGMLYGSDVSEVYSVDRFYISLESSVM